MRIVITCGPALAPIDEVRRITNFSTGEIGIRLANTFAELGHEVLCLKGEAATCPLPFTDGVQLVSFSTNDDLAQKLWSLAPPDSFPHGGTASGLSDFSGTDATPQKMRQAGDRPATGETATPFGHAPIDLIFHAAALCDYEVSEVRDDAGELQHDAKIPSRAGGLVIRLKPARKVLPVLRDRFPGARIVGWKYELNGGLPEALAAGRRQLAESRTNLCILNGTAYGPGFGLLYPDDRLDHVTDKPALCIALLQWSSAES